jgi:hypothetical protein
MNIINPETGSHIENNGFVYKNLILNGFKDVGGVMIPDDKNLANFIKLENYYILPKIYHQNNKTKAVFPDTGKELQYRTMFKTEERRNNFSIVLNNEEKTFKIIPNNKTNYEKTKDGHWLKKGTPAYISANNSNIILKKMVYAPNKKMIPVDSSQFNKLINDGFSYDEKENSLINPVVHLPEQKVQFPCGEIVFPSKITSLTLHYDDRIQGININEISEDINKYLFYSESKNGILYAISGGDYIKFGIAFDGAKNCLISELEQHCLVKNKYIKTEKIIQDLYIKYKNGVYGSDDYEDISKKLKLKIIVRYPPYNEHDKVIFGKDRGTRSMFYCNYNNNHIDTSVKKKWTDKPTIIHDRLTWGKIPETPNQIVDILGSFDFPISVETNDTIYRTKYIEFNEEKLDIGKNNSIIGLYTDLFIKNNPSIKPVYKKNFNINAIKSICQHGIMYCSKAVSAFELMNNYDIKNAYTTFNKCEYYTGFPTDLTYCINTEKHTIKDIHKIILDYEGFAYVKMICFWSKKEINRWVSFPYVRHYLENRDDKIDILYMMISRDKTDLNLDGLDVTKRMWHYILGNTNRTKLTTTYTTTDPLLAQTAKGSVEETFIKGVKVYRKTLLEDGISNKYFPHISGYVQNYTEIRLEQFVCANNITNIKRVWVDGIYCLPPPPLTPVKGLIKNKEFHSTVHRGEWVGEIPIKYNAVEPAYYSYNFEERLIKGDKVIINGEGGTGKTRLCKNLYDQTPNSIVLVPTNELKKQYNGCKCYTIDKLICDEHFGYTQYTTFLIDEYSMIPQEKITRLCKMYRTTNIILFGDNAQLGIITSYDANGPTASPILESDYNVMTLEKNYRQFNEGFQKKLNKLRKTGKFNFNKKIDSKSAINEKFLILSSTHADIDKLNTLGLILNENELIDGLKIDAPMRFYQSRKNYNAGEIGTITSIKDGVITITKENEEVINIKIEQFKKYHKLAYSMSYHAVQGKTLYKNMAVNKNNLFDKRMLYVACSRAVYEEQLHELLM